MAALPAALPATLPASFITPPRPPSSAAFGGVIELSQLWMGTDEDSGPVVCISCRTINRASAKVCKGCDGRLPAFYAAGGGSDAGEAPPSGDAPVRAEPLPTPRARAVFPALAQWSTVVWVAAALLVLYAAFGLWYTAYSASVRRPPGPAQLSLQAAAPAPDPAPASARTIDALNITLQPEAASDLRVGVPAPAPQPAVRAPVQQARADLPRKALSASTEPLAPASRLRSWDPLAACRGLNLFARAICMNNSCAQRASAGHPQCVQVLRQRRLDEARRNPTLVN